MQEELARIVTGYADNRNYLFELLYFWAWHPCAQLDRLAIVRLLENCERHLEAALSYLLDNQVLQRTSKNDVFFFLLTDAEPLRTQVLSLCRRNSLLASSGYKPSPILQRGVALYD